MGNELINKLIEDTTDKSSISDGVFTLGELHSDRLALFTTLINLISEIYKVSSESDPNLIWYTDTDNLGNNTPEGYIILGITLPEKSNTPQKSLACLLPKAPVLKYFSGVKLNYIKKSPTDKPLNEALGLL